jgi:hypothetical protein
MVLRGTTRGRDGRNDSYIDTFADELYDLTQGRGSPFKPQLLYAYENMGRQHEYLQEASPSHGATLQLAFWRTINLGFLPKQKDTPYYDRGIDFRFLDLRYRKNIARCFDGRVFFMTKKGYVGLGPMWTQYRDKVVIFDGAETPFVLWGTAAREDMAGWKLVGDCYVDGWMDGNCHGCEILNEPGESNNVAGQGDSVEGKVLVTRRFVIH